MVPGITETECRVAELRYRDLRANAERQRIAAHARPAPSDQMRLTAVIHYQVKALVLRRSRGLQGIRSAVTAGATAKASALGAVQ